MAKTKPDQSSSDSELPFMAHLVELRDRLLRVVVAVMLIFLMLFSFANDLYTMLAGPLLAHLPKGGTMIATEVASPFLTPFKLALVASVFLAMPVILYHAWAFVAPGLYQHEKRLALPLMVSSIILFYAGMAFAYFVVFPLVFKFLVGIAPAGVTVMTDISRYLDFVLKMFFAFGLAFEVPIATIIVVATGITTPQSLADKRPYIIVGAFTLAMLLTPPDVISQVLLALPMLLLFEFGLYFSRMIIRNRKSEETDEAEETQASTTSAATTQSSSTMPAMPDEGEYRELSDEEMEAELDRAIAEEESLQKHTAHTDDEAGDETKPAGDQPEK
ncbi:MAG: twin-arginine translocase subunit TatC [Gammaproteobacteria bacterium]|nr:twin-arginine translocase subunit TatC [Gammaproteobacteria bacterium]MDH5650246.1 twin-arginine translocase subunit TatC [Gammaproteobacteria bacterium]